MDWTKITPDAAQSHTYTAKIAELEARIVALENAADAKPVYSFTLSDEPIDFSKDELRDMMAKIMEAGPMR